jgi:hypothetical protein
MASNPRGKNFLHDIQTKQYRQSPAYRLALNSPALAIKLRNKSLEVVRLYQARVGKKTGRLAASAEAKVRIGGRQKDRIIGVASINDGSVQSEWKGKPFYYGVYHEQGTLNSKRARRRDPNGGRGPRPGYYELRRAAQQWRGGP